MELVIVGIVVAILSVAITVFVVKKINKAIITINIRFLISFSITF